MIFYRTFVKSHARTWTVSRSSALFGTVLCFFVLCLADWPGRAFAQGIPPGVEQEVEGVLEILHEDSDQESRYHYFLKAGGRRLTLQFAGKRPSHLSSGARVRVRGVLSNSVLALKPGSGSVETVSAGALNTLGEQRTLVLLVNFRNDTSEPYTVNFANEMVFGTTSNFLLENSYQQTFLSGAVKGWYTIDMNRPNNAATCDFSRIASLADQAATDAGVVLSNYERRVYAFPQTGCSWWGLSSVGGNPSQAWVNGILDLGVTAHELGHGLGLWHSHSLDCGTTDVVGANCSINEYGDLVDMMGASHSAHYNAFQKERLGWLNDGSSPPIVTVDHPGTYLIEGYESLGIAPKAIKILKSIDPNTGAKTWYYVESRKAIGFDSFLANEPTENLLNGILVRTGTDGNGDSSLLLDMTPATPVYYWWYDPALAAGQSFIDPSNGVTITAGSIDSSGAAVTVGFASAISISTDKPSYTRKQTVVISAMVQSGGVPTANASVSFTVRKSDGAVVAGSATTGSDGIAVYKLRLTRKDPVGTYEATAAASFVSAVTNFAVQ